MLTSKRMNYMIQRVPFFFFIFIQLFRLIYVQLNFLETVRTDFQLIGTVAQTVPFFFWA